MASEEWVSRVIERIRERAGVRAVLLGVSGGLDSMTLWAILRDAGIPHGVAHVDYGLRGGDSAEDREFVQATADRHGTAIHVKRLTPAERPSSNIQAAARAIRMAYFGELIARHGYAAALLAHHADDQLETMLAGVARGGGPRALAGMRPERASIVRPLLEVPRVALAQYAKAHGVTFRADASNATDRYLRNRLRHRVVPPLLASRPGVLDAASESASHVAALIDFAEGQLDGAFRGLRATKYPRALDRDRLRTLPGLGFFLREWLAGFGASGAQVRAALDLVRGSRPSGSDARRLEQPLGSDFALVITPSAAWVERRAAREPFAVRFDVAGASARAVPAYGSPPGRLAFTVVREADGPEFADAEAPGSKSLAIRLSPTSAVEWRTARRADRLNAGSGRRTRVRSVLAQAQRPPVSRGWDSVLVVDGAIAWVVGRRRAEPLPAAGPGGQLWRVTADAATVAAPAQPLPIASEGVD